MITDGSGGLYQTRMSCRWQISVEHPVRINFLHFDLESGYDTVVVYDGVDTEACRTTTLLNRHSTVCGRFVEMFSGQYDVVDLPEPLVIMSGNVLLVFDTDGSVQRTGFVLTSYGLVMT